MPQRSLAQANQNDGAARWLALKGALHRSLAGGHHCRAAVRRRAIKTAASAHQVTRRLDAAPMRRCDCLLGGENGGNRDNEEVWSDPFSAASSGMSQRIYRPAPAAQSF